MYSEEVLNFILGIIVGLLLAIISTLVSSKEKREQVRTVMQKVAPNQKGEIISLETDDDVIKQFTEK